MEINDIFQKKKTSTNIPKETKKIIIDYREKNSLVPSKLIKLNSEIKFKELKVGDYLIEDTIIERKEVKDFASSILDKRIFSQLKEIKQYPKYILIIEGNIHKINNLHPNAIKGTILSIATNYKIPIIQTENEEETAKYINIISKKQKKDFSLTPTKSNLSKKEQKLFILQSFPNIGPKKSKQLLERFNSLKEIFNSKEKKLEEILGKNAKSFLTFLE